MTLSRRADFLAANRGQRAPMPGFVLLVRNRDDGDPTMRLGITVTKKIGGAVVRNRMKRRFREIARAVLASDGVAGADHVLIGRAGGVERPFELLSGELRDALAKLRRNPRPKAHSRAQSEGQPKAPSQAAPQPSPSPQPQPDR